MEMPSSPFLLAKTVKVPDFN